MPEHADHWIKNYVFLEHASGIMFDVLHRTKGIKSLWALNQLHREETMKKLFYIFVSLAFVAFSAANPIAIGKKFTIARN